MRQSLRDTRVSRLLFIMCWIAYAGSYIGRLNYSAALAGMVESGVFTKSQGGLIGTVFFFCYGGGQILAGYFGDRLSSFKMVGTGLLAAAFSNCMMYAASASYSAMLLFWGLNGLANSLLWSPIFHIISYTLSPAHRKRACLIIASAVPGGTIAAYLVSMAVMRTLPYMTVFLAASVILAFVFVLWLLTAIKTKQVLRREAAEPQEEEQKAAQRVQPVGNKTGFFPLLTASGVVFIILPIMFQGMLNVGVTTWVPAMITEIYAVPPAFSLLLSVFLPLINLSGAYVATYLDDCIFHNEMKTSIVLFLLALIPVTVLYGIGRLPVVLCVIMLAMTTTLMLGINHMLITMVPFRLSKFGRAATLTGFLNAMAYAGSAISNYGFGALAETFGWNITILFWAGLVLAAVAFCVAALLRWTSFIKKTEEKEQTICE
ncbi:MAG: MFS transporter [Clostridia bacterium]